jgi:hypothetical protein
MSERQRAATVCGFGVRLSPSTGHPFRICRSDNALVIECQHPDGARSATVTPARDGFVHNLSELGSALGDSAGVELGYESNTWWLESSACRIPLPSSWTLLSSGERNASPVFELLGPGDSSICVRTSRRMPAIESFQGPGHQFRDIGQLDRGGWIEFEHTDESGTWLYRHEQIHRGTTPFVITLKAPLDQAQAHMAALANIVEQLELPQSAT